MKLDLNGTEYVVPPDYREESLLWVLREAAGLVGTKLGCGVGTCGACTVLVDGRPQRACLLPVQTVAGAQVETVEGLGTADRPHPLQRAWLEEQVPQCGYCQAGQLMAAAALLRRDTRPSDTQIEAAMAGQLCRCGTQDRIGRAIRRAAELPGRP